MAADLNCTVEKFLWDGQTRHESLKMYDRATTEAYLMNHTNVAVIRKPSPNALAQDPSSYLVLSSRNPPREPGEKGEFTHRNVRFDQANRVDVHTYVPHTTSYTSRIPNSGGRRKTKNHKNHKKAHKKAHKKTHKFRKTSKK